MTRNKWGIILSVALLVVGLALPRRVLAGPIDNGCPCGVTTTGCLACGTTDVYCVKVTPNPVTDPLCGGGVQGCLGVILDCADDESPVWNSTILSECSQCVKPQFNTGQRTWSGNRIRNVAGSCGGCRLLDGVEYCGQPVQRTDICTPKCPAGTVFTKVLNFEGCRNYDNIAGCDENRGQGSCKGANYRECWNWKPWQSYQCVGTCTPAAPAAPTLASPADGASVGTTSVTLMWNAVTWGTACTGVNQQYKVYVWEVGTGTPILVATKAQGTGLQYTFTGVRGKSYSWKVVATNGEMEATSATRTFTILTNEIKGIVYYDASNNCTGVPWNKGVGLTTKIETITSSNINNGTGAWTLTATPGSSYTVTLSGYSALGYKCSTCDGACSKTLASPTGSNSFHVTYNTLADAAWWQTEGAGIYAGDNIRSTLPDSSLYLILAPTGGTAAALFHPSGTTDLGSGSVSVPGWIAKSKIAKEMKYQYFAKNMGLVESQTPNWDVTGEITKEGYPLTGDYGYRNGTGTINSAITMVNEKYVIFVNGDLNINSDITVPSGAFLAFIVKGNITIGSGVSTLQGIYITDQNFVTETKSPTVDNQLKVSGTVVAWGSFSLNRNLGATNNFTTPAEKFSYRPDLLVNMPNRMKTFAMEWQEVVPGTFGN